MKDKIILYYPDTGGHNFTPPYELLLQAEALKTLSLDVILVDHRTDDLNAVLENHHQHTIFLVISSLIKYSSVTITRQFEDGVKVSELVKSQYKIPVVWTGLAASILRGHILEKAPYCYIIPWNSELLLKNLAESFIYRDQDTIITSKDFNEKNFNDAEIQKSNIFSNYGNFNIELINTGAYIHNDTFDYIATTGCINHCGFCSVPLVSGQRWHPNKEFFILKHLKYLFDKHKNLKSIHFRDDNFFVSKKFVFSLFQLFMDNNLYFTWSAQTSINILKTYSDDDLKKLQILGCTNISIGIESGDSYILEKVTHLKTNPSESILIIKRLLRYSISPSVTSIVGFPYNNTRDFKMTLKLLMKIKRIYPDLSLYCTIFQPIPGTETYLDIYDDSQNYTILPKNSWIGEVQRRVLKKYEQVYFSFCNKNFYKKFAPELQKKIKLYNLLLYPFIRLRFFIGSSSFLWEHAFVWHILKKYSQSYSTDEGTDISQLGIRHHNVNYNFGFNLEKKPE